MKALKSRLIPYAWVILGTAIAIGARLALGPAPGTLAFYGVLYLTVIASALLGGLWPAVTATLLGAAAADYCMVPPHFSFHIATASSQLGLAVFLGLGGILISLAEKQRRTQQQQIDSLALVEKEELRGSEERFRRLVEVSAQDVWVANPQGEITVLDSPSTSSRRRPLDQIVGVSNWLDAVHPDDRRRAADAWQHSVETGTPYSLELRFMRTPGEYRYVASHAAPILNADGTVREWIGMSADITDRKRTEQALAEAIQRLDAHMDNSPLAVVEYDPESRITRWSNEAERLFGWTAQEVLGRAMFDLPWVFEEDVETVRQLTRDMLDGKRPRNVNVNRNRRKNGSVLECEWYNSAIYGRDGKLASILAQALDVSERKRTEEKLRQAQKMESIAVLAGGVAHDFNNLLVGVIGNASLALELAPPGSPAVELLEAIVRSGEHAAHLTKQMLDYSGKGRFVLEAVDLSDVVREVTDLVRASAPKNIDIQLDLDPDLPAIPADRTQVHQVLMNLVINATEAIGGNAGVVAVRTGCQELDEDYIKGLEDPGLRPGPYVFLEVRDSGHGMDEATAAKIFDPFFSTKFMGRGLGLAAVSGIVRGHKGSIRVATAPGQGTSFTVFFPVAEAGTPEPKQIADPEEELRGTGTVLVVDDEDSVREMAQRGLERYGYDVLLARDGRGAAEALKTAVDRVSVVVLDLSMPGMSGPEVLPELQKIKPGVPVVISSGYGEEQVLKKFSGAGIAGFLQKPYSVRQLARKVKSARDAGLTTLYTT